MSIVGRPALKWSLLSNTRLSARYIKHESKSARRKSARSAFENESSAPSPMRQRFTTRVSRQRTPPESWRLDRSWPHQIAHASAVTALPDFLSMLGSWDLNPLVLTETIEPSFIVKIVAVWATAEKDNLVRFGAVARSEPGAWRRTHAGVPLRPSLVPIVEHPGIGTISTLQLIEFFPVLFITFLASIYALLKVPVLTNHIFSESSGGSSAGLLEGMKL